MIKLISWNINGIRAVQNKGGLNKLVNDLEPDIICLQEIKANKNQIKIDLKDTYYEYFNPAARAGYSGVGIISKQSALASYNNFDDQIINKYQKKLADNFGDLNQEGRVITNEYDKFFLVSVYTPNAKDDLSRLNIKSQGWDPAFLEYVKKLETIKPVIICGDLNVAHTEEDLANPKANKGKKGFTYEEKLGLDKLIDAGFQDSFRLFHQGNGHYTWWSYFANARARNVGWRIDYFLVSNKLQDKIVESEILANYLGSDHCPISLKLDLKL